MSRTFLDELGRGEYCTTLKQFQRDMMLDLILAWGSLDGALTMLVSAFTGENLHETADRFGKQKASMKLIEIARILENKDNTRDFGKFFRERKNEYEKHSKSRHRIAHAHCVGHLKSDDQYIVFAVSEREGDDNLAVETIPLQEMSAATDFAKRLIAYACQTSEEITSIRQRKAEARSGQVWKLLDI